MAEHASAPPSPVTHQLQEEPTAEPAAEPALFAMVSGAMLDASSRPGQLSHGIEGLAISSAHVPATDVAGRQRCRSPA